MLCRTTNRGMTVLAPAKLNLFLRIVARREDGFHEIESVMAAISLYDTLTLECTESDDVELKVIDASPFSFRGTEAAGSLAGPNNLVVRAAMLLKEYAGCRQGVRICLQKIPSPGRIRWRVQRLRCRAWCSE